jgi:flavin-dependent dehydrogenase
MNLMSNLEVKVSGAGISGLSAAITIAHNGKDVQIRDKASSIEEKVIRGINALRNYDSESDILDEYRKLGFTFNGFHPIYKQEIIISPSHYFNIKSESKPIFYTTPRGTNNSIDSSLLRQALALDIEVEWNSTFMNPNIIATGPTFNHCVGYGEHFIDVQDTSTITILQNAKYAPFGYACILPYSKNEATIVLGSFNPSKTSLAKNYQKMMNEVPQFKDFVKGASVEHQVRGYGNFGVPETAINTKKQLLVGEKAGFLEAFRGFGVHNAIMSGYASGLAIVNGVNYDDLWNNLLGKSLRRGMLRRITENKYGLSSEQILRELTKRVPSRVSLELFRSQLKTLEIEFSNNLDLSTLFQDLAQWNEKYPFINRT